MEKIELAYQGNTNTNEYFPRIRPGITLGVDKNILSIIPQKLPQGLLRKLSKDFYELI